MKSESVEPIRYRVTFKLLGVKRTLEMDHDKVPQFVQTLIENDCPDFAVEIVE